MKAVTLCKVWEEWPSWRQWFTDDTIWQSSDLVYLELKRPTVNCKLARVCSFPVGRCSGGRLAATLVATINVILFPGNWLEGCRRGAGRARAQSIAKPERARMQSIAKQTRACVQLHGPIEHQFNQWIFFLLLSHYLHEIRDCSVSRRKSSGRN